MAEDTWTPPSDAEEVSSHTNWAPPADAIEASPEKKNSTPVSSQPSKQDGKPLGPPTPLDAKNIMEDLRIGTNGHIDDEPVKPNIIESYRQKQADLQKAYGVENDSYINKHIGGNVQTDEIEDAALQGKTRKQEEHAAENLITAVRNNPLTRKISDKITENSQYIKSVVDNPSIQEIHKLSEQYKNAEGSGNTAQAEQLKAQIDQLSSQPFVNADPQAVQDEYNKWAQRNAPDTTVPPNIEAIQKAAIAQRLADFNKKHGVTDKTTVGDMYNQTVEKSQQLSQDKTNLGELYSASNHAIADVRRKAGFDVAKDENGNEAHLMGAKESFLNGINETSNGIANGIASFAMNDDEKIDALNHEISRKQSLYPSKPETAAGELAQTAGSVVPYMVQGAVLPESVVAQAIMSGASFGADAKWNSLVQAYQEQKDNDPNISDQEALDVAKKQSNFDAVKGALVGGVLPAGGAIGEGLAKKVLAKGTLNVLEKYASKVGIDASLFGGSQMASNAYANSNGAKRDLSEGVGDQVKIAVLFGTLHTLRDDMPAHIKNVYDAGLARIFPDIDISLNEAVNRGEITQEQANNVAIPALRAKEVLDVMPDNIGVVKEQKIMPLMREKMGLIEKKKTLDKSFHEPIDKKIDDIDGEIKAIMAGRGNDETKAETINRIAEDVKTGDVKDEDLLHYGEHMDAIHEAAETPTQEATEPVQENNETQQNETKHSVLQGENRPSVEEIPTIQSTEQTTRGVDQPATPNTVDNAEDKSPNSDEGLTAPVVDVQATTKEPVVSGIKKSLVPADIVSETPIEKRTTEQMMEQAKERALSGKSRAREIVKEIALGEARALQPEEVADLVHYKADLDNEAYKADRELRAAQESADAEGEAKAQLKLIELNKDIAEYHTMAVKTAAEQSLAFRLRQAMLDSQYNLQSQVNLYKAINKGEIPADVEAKFKELDGKLKEANAKIKELEENSQNKAAEAAFNKIQEDVKKTIKSTRKRGKSLIAEGLDELASALGVKLSAVGGERASLVSALSKIGRGLIQEGSATASNVLQKIREHLEDKLKGKINFDDYEKDVKTSLADDLGLPVVKDGKVKVPTKFLQNTVEAGVRDLDELVAIVHSQIKEAHPEITERDVRDAISGYGHEPVKQTKTEIQKTLDGLKKEAKYLSKSEDIKSGKKENPKLATRKKLLNKRIEELKDRLDRKDFAQKSKSEQPTDNEFQDAVREKNKIQHEYDIEQEKNRLDNRSFSEKAKDLALDAVNLPKGLMTTADLSAPLNQGLFLLPRNPIEWGKAFIEMHKQAFSQKKSEDWLGKLQASPEYELMKQSKLYIAEPNSKLSAKEEQWMTNTAQKIPLYGALVRGSERAYVGFLNKLRTDVFAKGADQLSKQGYTFKNDPEAYKTWANFVNNATGRGNLGSFEKAAVGLNTFFFSPRNLASKIGILRPDRYAQMAPPARKMALQNTLSFVAFGIAVLGLAKLSGADVDMDPRSSDFGKIKIGDSRYNILPGFGPLIRTVAQIATGERKSTSYGEIRDINRLDPLAKFGRSKLSPTVGMGVNVLDGGKDMVGNEITPQSAATDLVSPLMIQDLYSLYKDGGMPFVAAGLIPAMYGIGVQDYKQKNAGEEQGQEGEDISTQEIK